MAKRYWRLIINCKSHDSFLPFDFVIQGDRCRGNCKSSVNCASKICRKVDVADRPDFLYSFLVVIKYLSYNCTCHITWHLISIRPNNAWCFFTSLNALFFLCFEVVCIVFVFVFQCCCALVCGQVYIVLKELYLTQS